MSADLRPGPESAPTDELASAEASLLVLRQVLRAVSGSDQSKQTPCSAYNVKELTGHLLSSIIALGGMAGARLAMPHDAETVEDLVVAISRPALDAWHHRGLDGDVFLGLHPMPARTAAAVFSLEFLVHGWDYAVAVGRDVDVADPLSEYVLGLAQQLIKPHERSAGGFDGPVAVSEDSGALHRLVAFTGRDPAVRSSRGRT